MRGLFLSHGAPDVLLGAHPARCFWRELGQRLATPRVILMVSAHHEAQTLQVSADPTPATVHDFSGFPEPLYARRYAAPGAPAVARQLAADLRTAALGEPVHLLPTQGLDHGAWVPLAELFPDANVPVVQLSVLRERGAMGDAAARRHFALGQALRGILPAGALVVGSGALTHPLSARAATGQVPEWVEAFRTWVRQRLGADDLAALLGYRARAPHAARNHPTEEHLMPLFVLLGTFGAQQASLLHESVT